MSVNKIASKDTNNISKIIDTDISTFSNIGNHEIEQISMARFDPNKADPTMHVLADGTTIYSTGNTWRSIITDIGMNTGKIYFETEWKTSVNNYSAVSGICNSSLDPTAYHPIASVNVVNWKSSETLLRIQGSNVSLGTSWNSTNTIIGFAVDIDNKLIWTMKDGVWLYGDPSAGTGGESFTLGPPIYIFGIVYWSGDYLYHYFENWNYTPPTGFVSPTSALV